MGGDELGLMAFPSNTLADHNYHHICSCCVDPVVSLLVCWFEHKYIRMEPKLPPSMAPQSTAFQTVRVRVESAGRSRVFIASCCVCVCCALSIRLDDVEGHTYGYGGVVWW